MLHGDLVDEPFARRFCAQYLEAWNGHRPERVLELATDDVLWEDPTIRGGRAVGHEAVRDWLRSFWGAFPDMTFAFLDGDGAHAADAIYLSAGGRRVAAPWRCRGTLSGTLSPGFAPTGKSVDLTGVDLYAFRGGRLCHVRTMTDVLEAARQAGLFPRPASLGERALVAAQRLRARLPW